MGVGSAACPPLASARPLVALPPAFIEEANQPCVLYSCAANPQPHINWENKFAPSPTTPSPPNYCAQFGPCKPMDLVADHGLDDNKFPLNPDWGYFVEHKYPPDALNACGHFYGALSCTSQPVEYDGPGFASAADVLCPFGRDSSLREFLSFHGHVNWEPATYEGTLSWESHAAPIEDDEYSIDLKTPNRAGATADNGVTAAAFEGIHMEFDSAETINNFEDSPWWEELKKKVDESPDENRGPAAEAINGHLAVATGLIGLDTAHTPKAESHPVYAMAIQTDRKSAMAGDVDKWAVFARNWGNEGYCSSSDHIQPGGWLTVRIPWLRFAARGRAVSATRVNVLGSSDVKYENIDHPGVAAHEIPGEGVTVSFDLPKVGLKRRLGLGLGPYYYGTVDLKWTFGPPVAIARSSSGPAPDIPATRKRSSAAKEEESDVQVKAGRLFRRLPRATRLRAEAFVRHRFIALTFRRPRLGHRQPRIRIAMGGPLIAPLRTINEFVSPPLDPAVIALGKAQRTALCIAYKNRVPGYRAMCRSTKRRAARPRAQ